MAQNMMVAATALGLASCPMTLHDQACARRTLGLPDGLTAPMAVGFGHPAPSGGDRESSPRVPLDELVRWQRWS
jgi:nitroreductase